MTTTTTTTTTTTGPPDPPLDTARHIRYWQRCQRTLLPHHYTSNDSTRLTLGYFVLAALDLLSSPSSFSSGPPANPLAASLIPAKDRPGIRAWILSLQHPQGGFCGSPHHVLPAAYQTEWTARNNDNSNSNNRRKADENGTSSSDDNNNKTTTHTPLPLPLPLPPPQSPTHRDPENANIAATYFALLALGVLADDDDDDDGGTQEAFARVDRLKTLRWLRRLQREDGSFGENVDSDGYVAGGRDMRPCYLAATIRWILGGAEEEAVDFDVDGLVAHIRRSQAFDGGIAESSMHESHAGYAYCAVAALSLLDEANPDPSASPTHYLEAGIPSIPSLIHFLVSRQFAYPQDNNNNTPPASGSSTPDPEKASGAPPPDLSNLSISDGITGFNGRLNKAADTCYVWWVSGTLCLLGQGGLVDRAPARRFLLEKTEHVIGGFAKHPGGPPDIYHAYLGLAALATMAGAEGGENGVIEKSKEEGLGRFDPRLCVGAEAADRIRRGRAALLLAPRAAPTPEDSDDDDSDLLVRW